MSQQIASLPQRGVMVQFLELTKPRVNALIVFTAIIGMMLAHPVGIEWDLPLMLIATVGISLVAGAAAAFNCLVEQQIDQKMARTRARPTAAGSISTWQVLALAGIVGGAGLLVLYRYVNPLTMWLTLATFVGYAIVYTVILKPATPQNIVIGGASGAMPPILGWAAVAGVVDPHALLLFLIIFAWTPPHFWALALYRKNEYAKAGVPMLPVTHGDDFTKLHLLLYTFLLAAVTLLPFAVGMSGWIYLVSIVILNGYFLNFAIKLYRDYSDALARRTFAFSILYLSLLFAALLIDHYAALVLQ
ncbi:MAG: protoheme IX farnesyltransferase [Betaproteobacteria bacterium]|nr:protoheme IX farnesyltransferase [Betaproteobacteria bacterium]